MDVTGEHFPFEAQTFDDPGQDEDFWVSSVKVGGVEIIDLLEDKTVKELIRKWLEDKNEVVI